MRGESGRHLLILLAAAVIWGLAFVAQVVGARYFGAFSFNAVRFLIGAVSLIPVAAVFERGAKHPVTLKRTYLTGAVCGVIVFFASAFQQLGIQADGSAGKAGFITGLYLVFVPIAGIFFKQKTQVSVWAGVVLGCVGLYFLSVPDGLGSVSLFDVLLLANAVLWAVQILVIGRYSASVYSLRFSMTQFAVCGALSAVAVPFFGETLPPFSAEIISPLFYCGVLSVGVAYTLQVIGQKKAHPAKAAIIFSLEGIFAALGGAVILGERMTAKGYLGCGLIFAAIIVSQAKFERKKVENG